jgi:hypothetical protein
VLLIVVSGCSVLPKGKISTSGRPDGGVSGNMLKSVREHNIAKLNFYIQKAEIIVSTSSGKKKFLGSLKFEMPDKYLISLRTTTGIEVIRLFISGDTLMVNDRVNRILYCGSPEDLKKKYGITVSVIPLIFGDYINNEISRDDNANCEEGFLTVLGLINDIKVKYVIDCKREKIIRAVEERILNSGVEIKYGSFLNSDGNIIAGRVFIEDAQKETTIEIRIRKYDFEWEGNIEFIPGNRYLIQKIQ